MIEIKRENGVVICIINKSLVAANVKEMVEILKDELDRDVSYHSVVFDLSDSDYIDSMGITFLIGAYKTITAREKKVKLTGISNEMLDLFKIMRIDEIIEMEKKGSQLDKIEVK